MELICPNCNLQIPVKEINVATDLAKCTACGSLHKASQLVGTPQMEMDMSPPLGTVMEIYEEQSGEVRIATPRGLGWGQAIFMGFFSVFWLSFIAFWTWGASQGSIFFALFSIPFWLVGFFMAGGTINSFFGSQQIKIDKDNLILEIKRPIAPRKHVFPIIEIARIEMSEGIANAGNAFSLDTFDTANSFTKNSASSLPISNPTVIHGTKSIVFFQKLSPSEKEWAVKFLNWVVQEKKEKSRIS